MSSNNNRSHVRATTDFDGNNTYRAAGGRSFDDDVPAPLLGGRSDFNADFSSQFNNNRNQPRVRDEAKQPILLNADQHDDTAGKRPSAIGSRSKTTGNNSFATTNPIAASKASKKSSFFGLKSVNMASSGTAGKSDPYYSESNKRGEVINHEEKNNATAPICIGRRKIAVWPYDDYHLVQKMYYEKLQESALEAQQQQQNSTYRSKKDTDKAAAMAEAAAAAAQQRDQSVPIFSRPADPPDIPTAVQGLSLTQFEEKAEERAITIVSTWLFDAELIDELLVNGGMTAKMMNHHQIRSLDNQRGGDNLDGTTSVGDDSAQSAKTSEGVEVGSHGFPIEGSTKMDKEIAKLRNSTKRQLALINARLNDGVVATGQEVSELVNAVVATKDDIARLRELSTYVSNSSDVERTSKFMIVKYPKLKQTINARRNIGRVFRELDFFSSIPGTCDRLREELHSGEWTTQEWSSLRNVTREHCDLEIFLLEAESEMKKRLLEEHYEQQQHEMMTNPVPQRSLSSHHMGPSVRFDRGSFDGPVNVKQATHVIDRFLGEHVKNVWELGEEIRMRILSGISTSFELAMNNPAGMVALVEAVEVYELANEEFMSVHGENSMTAQNLTLKFTNMRAMAIAELHKDFETRCIEVFNELKLHNNEVMTADDPADNNDPEEASNKQFSAVLRAAHDLSCEIGIVKERMAPCFPASWEVSSLWTFSVAHVCCNNVLKQIGGPEGQKLSDLTVTQMLDLVAWVENFREMLLGIFPNLDDIASQQQNQQGRQQQYFDKQIKLLGENSKTIDMRKAEDSLRWVSNTLWQVHDLAKDEFLYRTKEQTDTWLTNVYEDEHNKAQTSEGRLVTSLCEDVYSLASVQIRTIRQRLTRRSEALVQAVGVVFKHLYEKQTTSRDNFCSDFETCCAAANDFLRMSDKCEEIIEEIKRECKLQPHDEDVLDEQTAALLTLYSSDAVFCAKKTHIYCFQPIEEAIANELFSLEWEQELTHNELALTLVRTLDDFMEDLETFLDELMVTKAVEAQISSSVNFYIRCLLKKSSTHNSKKSVFTNDEVAIRRMRGDSHVMREYFDGLAESTPSLSRIIETEFSLLECIFELISVAAGVSKSDAQDFILILQKRVKNIYITKLVVGDLWHLGNPNGERDIYELIDGMEDTLNAVAPIDEKASAQDRNIVPGLRTDEMMAKHVEEDNRRRPMKAEAIQKAQGALRGWSWLRKRDNEALIKQQQAPPPLQQKHSLEESTNSLELEVAEF